jgi:hypothetical protein
VALAAEAPVTVQRGIKMYETFHARPPRKVGAFPASFELPDDVLVVGKAVHVAYRSDKRDPETGVIPAKPIEYIHEHEAGVVVGLCQDDGQGGSVRRVPSSILNVDSLVLLGQCLEFKWRTPGGEDVTAEGRRPMPLLYATPSGKALVVANHDKRRPLAIIWGGKLRIEWRGIVG